MKKKIWLLWACMLIVLIHAQAQHIQKFNPTDASLKLYQYPAWFRDAKFGIWAHWGPQAVPRQGDWYAKNMYMQGSAQNLYHTAHYGHPSKVGYKDIIPLWKAEKWDPQKLMALYKQAGAKYFVSMGSHHDNFFLWNSRVHRWNAVKMGPHKDVVGLWQKAAKEQGLKFGVSEHLAASFNWFQPSHGADQTGPYAGIAYDGKNPVYAGLYHSPNPDSSDRKKWVTENPAWQKEWLRDVNELIDLYHPDLLYSDSPLPFGNIGRSMVSHFYNDNISQNGSLTAVYTPKQVSEGKWVQDVERGVLDSISPFPWQTDTSIGDWFYKTGQEYKSADDIAQLLADVISKNGNLLLNIVQTPEGDLEPDVLKIIKNFSSWIAANGEAVYGSRPWKVFGEGPSTYKANQLKGHFGELSDTRAYGAADIRYTVKAGSLYAFCMNVPEGTIRMSLLGKNSTYLDKAIASVSLLGSKEKLTWTQQGNMLVINKPADLPGWKVMAYKIGFSR